MNASKTTKRIEQMTLENPEMRPCDMAKKLGVDPKQIHSVHHRMKVKGLIPNTKKPNNRTQPISLKVKAYLEEHPEEKNSEIAKKFNLSTNRVCHIRNAIKRKETNVNKQPTRGVDLGVIIEVGKLCEKIGCAKVIHTTKFLQKLGIGK